MNRFYLTLATLMIFAQKALCAAETASPELNHALKNSTGEPGLMSILFALIFVISLIYVTGLIYSKLNIVGAKAVQEQLKNHDLSKVVVISTTQIGQNKNLHVIELNSKRYLIGSAPNAITLLKELGDAPKTVKKEDITIEPEDATKKEEEKEDLSEESVYKKYL